MRGMTLATGTTTGNIGALMQSIRDHLYTGVVSDILDKHGYLDQAMHCRIRPIDPSMRLVGRAHTVLTSDIYKRPDEPYGNEIAAIDSLKPGDCMVASTNNSVRTCLWGELLLCFSTPLADANPDNTKPGRTRLRPRT